MIDSKLVVIDWSGIAHRMWNRVHKESYESRHGELWSDFTTELVLEICRHRWMASGTLVFACDGERPYIREMRFHGWWDKHSCVWSSPSGDAWYVRKGVGPEGVLIEDRGDHWHRTTPPKSFLYPLGMGMEPCEDPSIICMAVEGCCPRYKERSWSWPEPKEDFERIHLAVLRKVVQHVPDCTWVRVPEMEADDVAATLCAPHDAKLVGDILLVSDDSDWHQLRALEHVDGMDFDWDPWKGERTDAIAAFWAKVLAGDTSDGVPGLMKTATTRWGKDGALAWVQKNGIEKTMMPNYGTPEWNRNLDVIALLRGGDTVEANVPSPMQDLVLGACADNWSQAESITIPWDTFGVSVAARSSAECVSRGFRMDVEAQGQPVPEIPY